MDCCDIIVLGRLQIFSVLIRTIRIRNNAQDHAGPTLYAGFCSVLNSEIDLPALRFADSKPTAISEAMIICMYF